MQRDFGTQITGWFFVAAGVMLWAGWMLLPHRLGTYLLPDDFAPIRAHLWIWIWMYRVHIFGLVITAMALFALAALVADRPVRAVIWPGVGVAAAGTFVSALAAAFYYHHGAWGAISLDGKGTAELQKFVDDLKVHTEYITCLVRFGRVFTGLGLLVLGLGLAKWNVLPKWVGSVAMLLGLAAMGLTMGLPDHLALYLPVFHLQCLWLIATGIVILRSGVQLSPEP